MQPTAGDRRLCVCNKLSDEANHPENWRLLTFWEKLINFQFGNSCLYNKSYKSIIQLGDYSLCFIVDGEYIYHEDVKGKLDDLYESLQKPIIEAKEQKKLGKFFRKFGC